MSGWKTAEDEKFEAERREKLADTAEGTGDTTAYHRADVLRTAQDDAGRAASDEPSDDEAVPSTTQKVALDRELDVELEDTFPASDPPSLSQPLHTGAPERPKDA